MWVAKQKLCSVTNDSSIAQSKLSISKEPPPRKLAKISKEKQHQQFDV